MSGRSFPTRPHTTSTPPPTRQRQQQGGGGNSAFRRVGAGWNTEAKNGGKSYIKIKLDDNTVLYMFPNDKKSKDTDPDFSITIKED